MKRTRWISKARRPHNPESGQVNILILLALGIFFLAFIGFAVDYSNLWFHRQMAQTAADAACQAGAMDMLVNATNGTTLGGFPSPLADFDCTALPSSAPCRYAALNGFTSSALAADTPGINVQVSFPSTVPGITPPPSSISAKPFIRVDVDDRTAVYFSGLLSGNHAQDVRATATCGLQLLLSSVPILVLHPTMQNALSTQGNPDIIIRGGPPKSIQVNSSNTRSVNIGGSASIDLSQAGPNYTGGDLGTFGGPSSAPGGFTPGSTGHWLSPSSPIADPFATLAAPTTGGLITRSGPTATPAYGVNGCPDSGGCDEYSPGVYLSGITVKHKTAIFNPGIYYVVGGMSLEANSTVRPSADTSAPGGTMFYFSGTGTISVAANSGKDTSLDPFITNRIQCPGGTMIPGLPSTVNGNILIAPCTGTYGGLNGQYRGMLFFQDRGADSVDASWGGGGQFLLAGNMYFHKCRPDGAGAPCLQPPSGGYTDSLTMQGNSGSGTFLIGEIVTDSLQLGGTSGIKMYLDPGAPYNVLKAVLLR
ncbi:MAG: Tad domain-containing protein [Acidobacteriia bacterium]|nr:Tad domain-containing protein [Terriglobia bacterium]